MAPGSSVAGSASRGSGVPVGEDVRSTDAWIPAQRARSCAPKLPSARARAASAATKAL